MLRDTDCGIILCLAGSLISAGLKKVFVDMIRNNMVDAIVSHRRQHRRPGFLRSPRLQALHRRRRVQERHPRRRTARSDDRPHLRHAHRRGRPARSAMRPPRKSSTNSNRALQLARTAPGIRRLPRSKRRPQVRRQHLYECVQARRADLRARIQRLLGRIRHRRPPARPTAISPRSASTAARISTNSRS